MYKPLMYKKNILDINYETLKKMGIKALFFDFDNTLIKNNSSDIDYETKERLNKLNKDFKVYVVSNSINFKRLNKILSPLNIDFVIVSLKPFAFGFNKALKRCKCKRNEVCVIGDQIYTDIKGAYKNGFYSCLIDPLGSKENIFTKFNRLKEDKVFKRGNYYE